MKYIAIYIYIYIQSICLLKVTYLFLPAEKQKNPWNGESIGTKFHVPGVPEANPVKSGYDGETYEAFLRLGTLKSPLWMVFSILNQPFLVYHHWWKPPYMRMIMSYIAISTIVPDFAKPMSCRSLGGFHLSSSWCHYLGWRGFMFNIV